MKYNYQNKKDFTTDLMADVEYYDLNEDQIKNVIVSQNLGGAQLVAIICELINRIKTVGDKNEL